MNYNEEKDWKGRRQDEVDDVGGKNMKNLDLISGRLKSRIFCYIFGWVLEASVARFGKISTLLQNFQNSFFQYVGKIFSICFNLKPTLAKVSCYWTNFHHFTSTNIE